VSVSGRAAWFVKSARACGFAMSTAAGTEDHVECTLNVCHGHGAYLETKLATAGTISSLESMVDKLKLKSCSFVTRAGPVASMWKCMVFGSISHSTPPEPMSGDLHNNKNAGRCA
jgi:hypothetical protein